jgi:hypothetical protein
VFADAQGSGGGGRQIEYALLLPRASIGDDDSHALAIWILPSRESQAIMTTQ